MLAFSGISFALSSTVPTAKPRTPAIVLATLVANVGRISGKQDLISAVWLNIDVAEDGLFQCIREIRAAFGDNDLQS